MDAAASSWSSQLSGKDKNDDTKAGAVLASSGTEGVEALTGHKAELKQTLSLWALLALSYSNMVRYRARPASPPRLR